MGKCFLDTKTFIRNMFGDKCFETLSDRGGVLVGNENFQTLIRNGYGNGVTTIAVLPLYTLNDLKFWSTLMEDTRIFLDGKFNIYSYDCSTKDVSYELNGRYTAYYYCGLVLFLELDK